MGQRHQIYAIARVRGRYRCLAAFHHQWLYGCSAVAGATSSAKDVRQHARLIKKELLCLEDLNYTPKDPNSPCPFLWTRLRKWNGTTPIDVDSNPSWQDNNDGITVIDVTDPFHPGVCFADPAARHSELHLSKGVPLTPRTYISNYYSVEKPSGSNKAAMEEYEMVTEALSGFDSEDFQSVEAYTLAEAWPESVFGKKFKGDEGNKGDGGSQSTESVEPETVEETPFREALAKASSSLEDDAIVAATSLINPETVDDAVAAVKAMELPDQCLPIVIMALEAQMEKSSNGKELDISKCKLSSEQIVAVVSQFPNITSLDLSQNPQITPSTLSTIIKGKPKSLKELILFNMSGLRPAEGDSIDVLRDEGLFKSLKVFESEWLAKPAVDELERQRLGIPEQLFFFPMGQNISFM
ncbi:hypothetical protein FRB99_005355 [Tulasnella sp. 403]|nr:hypothetical protein FRB99_005355 [Tulasnella sp. 403]